MIDPSRVKRIRIEPNNPHAGRGHPFALILREPASRLGNRIGEEVLLLLLSLMLLQAGTALAPVDFDLAQLKPSTAPCKTGRADEIVVCGSNGPGNRLVPVEDRTVDGLPKAEIGLFGNVRGGVGVQRNDVGGFPSNRVMATVKIPF